MEAVLHGAAVFDANDGRTVRRDLCISQGRLISAQGHSFPVLDLHGLSVFPGFTDVHVHFREPGFSYKDTIAASSRAAARGGYTTVCPMPNLKPVPDSAAHLEAQLALIRRDSVIRCVPYGAITKGEFGQDLSDMEGMAPHVAGFSDDGKGVQRRDMMRRAMQEAKRLRKIIAAHCEDNALLRGGYIHDGAYARAHGHRGICSESEWGPIARDLELVRETGCAYHVCHVSTKESVELIRSAKAEGLPVSCETAPHYLLLDETDLREDGRFKMNPPLRSGADRAALLEGLRDGTIDLVATDHAPHSAEEKSRGLEKSAMGVVGLEIAFPLLYTYLVKPGTISLARLMELLCGRAQSLFGLGSPLEPGAPADFSVWDLEAEYDIDPAEFLSRGRATPFAGRHVSGRCRMTVCGGAVVWDDGSITRDTTDTMEGAQ
ncbi:MAG: dihydroorotase [Oscillospiraceae bacterium]|nr:dihydroorotase [Oscillospiraceae bacterium]